LETDYVLTRDVLGVGINGGVRLAMGRGSRRGRKFAVKSIDITKCAASKKRMLDVVSELEIMLTVDHPHIIRLYDVYETATELHLVMECADGGELFDRLVQQGRFSEVNAAEATRQMLSAVSYLHSQSITHRDLKPENFLYEGRESAHLKLIDFGCSRYCWGKSEVSEMCGTLSYMAPEILKHSCTSQSDLWSLGIISFMLLSGYAPFEGDRKRQSADIANGKYSWRHDYWKHVSSDAVDFVKSLLCLEPSERLTAQAALQHQWIRAANVQVPASPTLHLEVARGLQQFQGASKFRQSCLLTTAHSMMQGDVDDEVRSFFLHADRMHSGVVLIKHLSKVATANDSLEGREANEIQQAFGGIDVDKPISYSTFLAAMLPILIKPQEALLSDAFRRFEADSVCYGGRDSQLSAEEFSKLVQGGSEISIERLDELDVASALSSRHPKGSRLDKLNRWWERMMRQLDEATYVQYHESAQTWCIGPATINA
jgi:calcium-dependent protein kinase